MVLDEDWSWLLDIVNDEVLVLEVLGNSAAAALAATWWRSGVVYHGWCIYFDSSELFLLIS